MKKLEELGTKMKRCPFCGKTARLLTGCGGKPVWAVCDNLNCVLHMQYQTEEQAIAAWNRRTGKEDE